MTEANTLIQPSPLEEVGPDKKNLLIELQGVTVQFDSLLAINGLNMEIASSGITSVIGPNGAGKTTFFNVLSGVVRPNAGRARFGSLDLTRASPQQIVQRGMVRTFQDVRLFRRLSVLDNILVSIPDPRGENLLSALFIWRENSPWQKQKREKAMELLEFVGMQDFAGRLAEDLSYGQQKLVAIARALAPQPNTLLLDEPASGLDASKIDQMLALIDQLVKMNKTIVLIEHNIDLVIDISDWVVVMHEGRAIVEGKPEAVVRDERVLSAYLGE